MRDIRLSAEVEILLGPEAIARAHQDDLAAYTCHVCREHGHTDTDPASLLVTRYRSRTLHVTYAHARCADSQVVYSREDGPRGLTAETRIRATTAVLSFATDSAARPLLLLEALSATGQAAAIDQASLFLARLTGAGLTPVATGHELPRRAEGWTLLLHRPEAAILHRANGTIEYEGECDQPMVWRQIVLSTGTCCVIAGRIGLDSVPRSEMTALRLMSLIDAAARAGELVGGVVTVADADS